MSEPDDELLKANYIILACDTKAGKSDDYRKGFDEGVAWLAGYISQLTNQVKEELEKL